MQAHGPPVEVGSVVMTVSLVVCEPEFMTLFLLELQLCSPWIERYMLPGTPFSIKVLRVVHVRWNDSEITSCFKLSDPNCGR